SYVPQLSTPGAYDRCCAFKGSIQGNKSGSCGHGWKQSDCAIAFGICKEETGPCWSWWMSVLKERIGDNPNLLFIYDRHPAIAMAVENEFPLAFHAAYTRKRFIFSFSTMASRPENVRLTVLMKLQEELDEEAILDEQMLALMHRFTDRFTYRRVEINNLMALHDHPLIDYGKYALGCMTGADMKKCVKLKGVRESC
nr:transposase, MuDR, MULE transposase domain protein [Tanacetum cinerariifolium]